MNILVSDIWGITPHLHELACQLGSETIIHDPYHGDLTSFKNEQQAYYHFMNNSGVDSYSKSLAELLNYLKTPVNLIGFSTGASAIWNLTNRTNQDQIQNAICFYGGQIRNALNVSPKFKTIHIMPSKEEHFDLSAMLHSLKTKPNTEVIRTEYLHGFMNRCSTNFSEKGFQEYMTFTKESL
ncbi:MAG: hypothetical protein ACPGUD_09085 [Parashewanella sp.]